MSDEQKPAEFPADWDTQENVDHAEKLGLPEGVHLELAEAPLGAGAPNGSVAINVPVNVIIDQVHMHWAQQMAAQIQRNAELAAALTVTQEALQETQAKLAALTEVTNAPADGVPPKVRNIPASDPGEGIQL